MLSHVNVDRARIFSVFSPVSLSVFSLVPDILFDCSRAFEYAKIRTVSQARRENDPIETQY